MKLKAQKLCLPGCSVPVTAEVPEGAYEFHMQVWQLVPFQSDTVGVNCPRQHQQVGCMYLADRHTISSHACQAMDARGWLVLVLVLKPSCRGTGGTH